MTQRAIPLRLVAAGNCAYNMCEQSQGHGVCQEWYNHHRAVVMAARDAIMTLPGPALDAKLLILESILNKEVQ